MGLRHRLLIAVVVGGVVAGATATYLANAAVQTGFVAPNAVPSASGAATEVRYPFDGESLGGLAVAAIAGGQVRAEARDGGQAVRFPPRCPVYGGSACPRVVLESHEVPNPGRGPVRFGAAVLM